MSIKSLFIFLLLFLFQSLAVDTDTYIVFQKTKGSFPMAEKGMACSILMDKNDFSGAILAGKSLQTNI